MISSFLRRISAHCQEGQIGRLCWHHQSRCPTHDQGCQSSWYHSHFTLRGKGLIGAFYCCLGENLVDEIADELEMTQLNKARIEALVDRLSNIFVIAVVILAFAVPLFNVLPLGDHLRVY